MHSRTSLTGLKRCCFIFIIDLGGEGEDIRCSIPYRGKFSNGASFCVIRKCAKFILTVPCVNVMCVYVLVAHTCPGNFENLSRISNLCKNLHQRKFPLYSIMFKAMVNKTDLHSNTSLQQSANPQQITLKLVDFNH